MTPARGDERPPLWLFEAVFRVSDRFELVVFDRLEPVERKTLEPLRGAPGFYGVLRPRSGGTLKAVGRDLALLLHTLREPGRLPFFVRDGGEEGGLLRRIVALVADGVLDVDTGNGFVTGGDGLEELTGGRSQGEPFDLLGGLARSALLYAEALGLDDRELLAERLYAFGRLPLSPHWERRFPDAAAVLAEVGGMDRPGWRRLRPRDVWICWQRRGADPRRDAQAATFKLYLSPRPESLAEAFAALPEALDRGRALQLKVGASATGLLRPDKLVTYFATEEDLFEAADLVGRRLEGLPVHGVPFSAPAGGSGLLSWGLDPPAARRLLSWRPRSSWRSWVVDRLAAAMVEAREERPQAPAWRSALARLELEGVDTASWTPDRVLWGQTGAGSAHG